MFHRHEIESLGTLSISTVRNITSSKPVLQRQCTRSYIYTSKEVLTYEGQQLKLDIERTL